MKAYGKLNDLKRFVEDFSRRLDESQLSQVKHSIGEILEEVEEIYTIDENQCQVIELSDLYVHPNVKVESAPGKGRYFVAKDLIEANTLIVRERPLSVSIVPQKALEFCDYCHKRVINRIVPCRQCTEVVYCSQICGQIAFEDYHLYECGLIGFLFNCVSPCLQLFRLFVQIGVQKAIECYKDVKQNGYDFNRYLSEESMSKPQSRSKERMIEKFKFFTYLEEHTDKEVDPMSNIYDTFSGIGLTFLLNYCQALDQNIIENFDSFISFTDIVCGYFSRIRTNIFGWQDCEDDNFYYLANCLLLFSSLINHSCDPNIEWFFSDKSIFFKTIREIKAGEEINNSYGFFETSDLLRRQYKLKSKYHFQCGCAACHRCIGTVRSLRCLQCDGPVIYDSENDLKSCFKCFKSYSDAQSVVEKVEIHSKIFESSLKELCIRKEENGNHLIEVIQSALITNLKLVYKLSPNLLSQIRQFIGVCHHFSQTERAVKLSKHLLPAIDFYLTDWSSVPTQIVTDLFLLTRIHFKHLTQSPIGSTDSTQWRTGLQIYSKTIELCRKLKTKKHVVNGHSDLLLKRCHKQLKQEFRELTKFYDHFAESGIHLSTNGWSALDANTDREDMAISAISEQKEVKSNQSIESNTESNCQHSSESKSNDIFSSSDSEPSIISYESSLSLSEKRKY